MGVSWILYRLEDAAGTTIVVDGVTDAEGDADRFFIIRLGRGTPLPGRFAPVGITPELQLPLGLTDADTSGAGVGCERP